MNKKLIGIAFASAVGGMLIGGYLAGYTATAQTCATIGDKCSDGAVYAGVSPDSDVPMYTTRADASPPGTYTWTAATEYCADLVAHGHDDWSVPSIDELSVLYNNRAAIGNFNVSGLFPAGWYWSSMESRDYPFASAQRFDGGYSAWGRKSVESSLRCVRS